VVAGEVLAEHIISGSGKFWLGSLKSGKSATHFFKNMVASTGTE